MSSPRPPKEGPLVFLLYALLVTAYFFSFFFRVSASVVLPQEASRLGLSAATAGFISSLYYYAYAVTQPLCGALHDRLGPLRVVAFGMALTGAGEVLYILSPTALSLGLWRLLTGLGLAPMFSGALLFQSRAFPQERYPFYAGVTLAVGNLGAVVSVAPLGFALERWGKTSVFSLLALVSFALAAALVILGGKTPGNAGGGKLELAKRMGEAARTIALSPPLRAVILLWGLLISALLAFQGLWAVAWYRAAFDVTTASARNWATLIGIGVIVGTLAGGRLKGPRATILRRGYALAGILWILLLALAALTDSIILVGSTGFLVGLASGIVVVQGASAVNELTEPSRRGAVLGMANLLIYVGVIAFQWGTGSLIGLFEGTPGQYAPTGFLLAFGVTTLLIAGGTLCFPRLSD